MREWPHTRFILAYYLALEIDFEERMHSLCIATCAQDAEAAKRLMDQYESAMKQVQGNKGSDDEPIPETPTPEQLRKMIELEHPKN